MKLIAIALLILVNGMNFTVNDKPHFWLGFVVRCACVAGIVGLIK